VVSPNTSPHTEPTAVASSTARRRHPGDQVIRREAGVLERCMSGSCRRGRLGRPRTPCGSLTISRAGRGGPTAAAAPPDERQQRRHEQRADDEHVEQDVDGHGEPEPAEGVERDEGEQSEGLAASAIPAAVMAPVDCGMARRMASFSGRRWARFQMWPTAKML
jgi:hypothetical protein